MCVSGFQIIFIPVPFLFFFVTLPRVYRYIKAVLLGSHDIGKEFLSQNSQNTASVMSEVGNKRRCTESTS
jgi:hypothetical protein